MSNLTDLSALAAQPDVRVHYVHQPEELAGADLVTLPGSKNTLDDSVWLRESGMTHGVVQLHHNNVPVMGIYGGYQVLGDTIIDEVGSGLGTLPGLGLLNTVTHFAQCKATTLVEGEMSLSLSDWLAGMVRLSVRGYEIHMGETTSAGECRSMMTSYRDGGNIADGMVAPDGLAFGTYLRGLFDSDDFTRVSINDPRERKGLTPLDSTFHYAQYKPQQFDLLTDVMRQHIDIEKIYATMQRHREPVW